jgi:muramoyltetrapeptide carboxypeptidase
MPHFPAITSGARVALVAPAGPLRMPVDLDRAMSNARAFGWEPVVGEHADERDAYFAGDDGERLADLNAALRDDRIDAIWCLRGGYGAMRLLEGIDYDALRRRPKAVIGYSDITAIHCAVATKTGLATIHGPTARSKLTPFSERSLRAAATRDGDPCGVSETGETLVPGRARGRLMGGNLALLSALHGTPFQPDYAGVILVLEDVNEAPYRIERMLVQLRLSGSLQRCAGIAFGSFTNTGQTEEKSLGGSRSLDNVLREAATIVGVPAVSGIPVGHIDDQWSLPLGAEAELDADEKRLTVLGP